MIVHENYLLPIQKQFANLKTILNLVSEMYFICFFFTVYCILKHLIIG